MAIIAPTFIIELSLVKYTDALQTGIFIIDQTLSIESTFAFSIFFLHPGVVPLVPLNNSLNKLAMMYTKFRIHKWAPSSREGAMKERTGTVLRVILLLTFAFPFLGFRSGSIDQPDSDRKSGNAGFINITIHGGGEGHERGNDMKMTWHSAEAALPVFFIDPQHNRGSPYRVVGKTLYTVFEEDGSHGIPRIGTTKMIWPVVWDVSASIDPLTCDVSITVHERWLPGTMVACAPYIGCKLKVNEVKGFPHAATMKIPHDQNMGTFSWKGWASEGKLVILIDSMEVGIEPAVCRRQVEYYP